MCNCLIWVLRTTRTRTEYVLCTIKILYSVQFPNHLKSDLERGDIKKKGHIFFQIRWRQLLRTNRFNQLPVKIATGINSRRYPLSRGSGEVGSCRSSGGGFRGSWMSRHGTWWVPLHLRDLLRIPVKNFHATAPILGFLNT